MELTNEIVEKYGFKRINNSTWRKGNWTLQNGHTSEGVTIYEKLLSIKKAYKLCIDGKYSQMITSEELLAQLVRGREVDAGISKCNKHIVSSMYCCCEVPKYNYPEMVWCDTCGKEIKD